MLLKVENSKVAIHGFFNGQDFGNFGWDIPVKDGFLPAASTSDPAGIKLVFDRNEMYARKLR